MISTPVVKGLALTCLISFGLQQLTGTLLLEHLALWPPGPRPPMLGPNGVWHLPDFAPWQMLSYGLLHGSVMHLLLNLIGLWLFGRPVEQVLGSRRFALYAVVCTAGAALAQLLVSQITGEVRPTVGASGLVFGLLPAFALFFPQARVQLLFPPISLRAPVFVLLYGAVEFLFGISDTLPGIAHFAHLGGLVCGLGLLLWWWSQARNKSPG